MKKIVLVSLALLVLSTAVSAQKVSLKIKGSDTCTPLMQIESEQFMKKKTSSITVIGGGSGAGLSALISGQTDIAMSSRKIKPDEKLKLQDAGKTVKEVIFAQDAVSFIVNPENKIRQFTREQLEGIFTGKITNWKQLGGDDMIITAYSREPSSGTYEFVKESVLKGKNFGGSMRLMPASGAIVQSVSQTKGAIGYVGPVFVGKDVKAVKVSYDSGKNFIEPSIINVQNKRYPIIRPLMLYYLSSSEKNVSSFVGFLLSQEGQKIAINAGYVPSNK